LVYYDFTAVKKAVGETGSTNDEKIAGYGLFGDNFINSDLIKVRNINLPATESTFSSVGEFNAFKDIATQITIGYFYKFESGDMLTLEQAEKTWAKFFTSKFKRPRFVVR